MLFLLLFYCFFVGSSPPISSPPNSSPPISQPLSTMLPVQCPSNHQLVTTSDDTINIKCGGCSSVIAAASLMMTCPAEDCFFDICMECVKQRSHHHVSKKQGLERGNTATVLSPSKPPSHVNGPAADSSTTGDISIINAMKDLLTKDSEKRDKQHKELLGSVDELKNTVSNLQSSLETEKTTRETEAKEIKKQLDQMVTKEDVTVLVKKEMEKNIGLSISTSQKAQEAELRSRQIIVTGFGDDTDANIITKQIEDFLDSGSRRAKVVEVDTFTDPSSIGYITFKSVAAKIGFYRMIAGHGAKLENGNDIKFKDNEPEDDRYRNSALGQIKFQVNKMLTIPLKDIKIDRAKGEVKVKSALAATFVNVTKQVKYEDNIKVVKDEVEKVLNAKPWVQRYLSRIA